MSFVLLFCSRQGNRMKDEAFLFMYLYGHEVKEILVEGTRQARRAARETMLEVREAMGIRYFD
ncbi:MULTISPECIES: hypothetical protein [unclassified Paenibacillus]|uniref:hypothetical protein n=1 Tax=unclassified Paenibacillus TaxID=185978 RepID=UPI0004A5ECEB|nr:MULTISPECIES: hypothetical protein [unclassified Paenibacillus]KGP82099.1 hypothetical protein P364_0113655 [Paenibacillus sp. MAEPY2]KGP84796.1 hypothetical protein P363_0123175 [Paenibacillus sp. MAEPY1]